VASEKLKISWQEFLKEKDTRSCTGSITGEISVVINERIRALVSRNATSEETRQAICSPHTELTNKMISPNDFKVIPYVPYNHLQPLRDNKLLQQENIKLLNECEKLRNNKPKSLAQIIKENEEKWEEREKQWTAREKEWKEWKEVQEKHEKKWTERENQWTEQNKQWEKERDEWIQKLKYWCQHLNNLTSPSPMLQTR